MDQWACDRRDMRVNEPRERIAAAACESLIRKTTCFAGLNFTTLKLRICRLRSRRWKSGSRVEFIELCLQIFALDRTQKIAQKGYAMLFTSVDLAPFS